jgi:hypothetical protein
LRRPHRSWPAVTVWVALLALLATGCASSPPAEDLRAALDSAPVCCTSPREFPFRPVAIEQRAAVVIDARSPVYRFPHGKSFLAAFALPMSPHPAFATVATFPVLGKNLLNEWVGSYFSPVLLFYDEQFQPSGPFEGPTAFMFNGNGRRFSALRVPVPPQARYLVVYTDARLLNTTLPVPVEFSTVDTNAVACDVSGRAVADLGTSALVTTLCGIFAGLSIYTPPQAWTWYATIPYSAGGNLELWLSGLEPKQP